MIQQSSCCLHKRNHYQHVAILTMQFKEISHVCRERKESKLRLKIGQSLDTPILHFIQNFYGLLFGRKLKMCLPNLKSVPEIIGDSQKISGSPWLCQHSLFPKNPISLPHRLFSRFPTIFDWSFGWGLQTPILGKRKP